MAIGTDRVAAGGLRMRMQQRRQQRAIDRRIKGPLSRQIAVDWRKHWSLYLMLLPLVLFVIVWNYGPMYGVILAFKRFSPKLGIMGSPFVGLQHFRDFFASPFAYRVIRNTLLINFYNLLVGFPAPILLALLLNEVRNRAFKRTVQTISYMPYFISIMVVAGLIVDFTASDGVFGTIATMFGARPVNLLGDARYFRSIYVLSDLWQSLGWNSIIFLSALTAINSELYEAARIDGAGRLRQVWHITLPGILPTIAILLVLRVGAMMSLGFEKIILLYNGVTYETADVISSFVYRKGIAESNFAFATAVGLFNSVVNFILVIGANRASAKLTDTSLW